MGWESVQSGNSYFWDGRSFRGGEGARKGPETGIAGR